MRFRRISTVSLLLLGLSVCAGAQTTGFTYQGKLTDAGTPANGNYDLQFKLFDTVMVGGGTQQGATLVLNPVVASAGVFTVTLDFGANVFSGAERYLEIGVRPAGSASAYTVLAPRQPVTSSPYTIQSLNATNATQLGGVTANQYVTFTSGATSYIQNQNSGMAQPSTNFNISGNGTAGGVLSGNIVNATTQYDIGGVRVLSADVSGSGPNSTFVGGFAGTNNMPTGVHNSFFGYGAGFNNDTGGDNSFFGYLAGEISKGFSNSIFGSFAGASNTTGSENSFFGRQSGVSNTTGNNNAFFGRSAGGLNTTGTGNAFFGRAAGEGNLTGNSNAFFGDLAGNTNSASGNSFFGASAGQSNLTATGNSFFGFQAGMNNTVSNNAFFGYQAGLSNTSGQSNSFFGFSAGRANTSGFKNSFFGNDVGVANTTGFSNAFFGTFAGAQNTTGSGNTFLGTEAGDNNTTGGSNSFAGSGAGSFNSGGSNNSFFGAAAGFSNGTANDNSFMGYQSGVSNSTGTRNSFFGSQSGFNNTVGDLNTFIGYSAGNNLVSGSNNTALGAGAFIANGISNATAIGAGAFAENNNTVVVGTNQDAVIVPGIFFFGSFSSVSSTPLCVVSFAGINQFASCSSSLRYKTNVHTFNGGLEIINRLRPISFTWKEGGLRDIGLGAEEVERVEPLLTFRNSKGEIEGVRYTELSAVFINAIKEQQTQIEQQRTQAGRQEKEIEELKRLIRVRHPKARVYGQPRKSCLSLHYPRLRGLTKRIDHRAFTNARG